MKPENFKIILWDFDGVIINSNSIREKGFRLVLKEYESTAITKLIKFHNQNGGWSRYVKFRYFFEEILNQKVSNEKINHLAKKFSDIMAEKLAKKELLIEESILFLEKMKFQKKEMHIVSGSDEKELIKLCHDLQIDKYFKTIKGSPKSKEFLIKNILISNNNPNTDYCLIGDSINDYEAAVNNDISFFGFNNPKLKKYGVYLSKF